MSCANPGTVARDAVARMLATVREHEEELGRLDAVAGDGDHGRGMVRGLGAADAAAAEAAEAGQDAAGVIAAAGKGFGDAAGGASGALWGAMLSTLGASLAGASTVDAAAVHAGLTQAMAMVMRLGRSKPGDKTLLDALGPFVDELGVRAGEGQSLTRAWCGALPAALDGVKATESMTPRRGRSAVLADRSVGSADPGATSLAYCLQAAGDALRAAEEDGATA